MLPVTFLSSFAPKMNSGQKFMKFGTTVNSGVLNTDISIETLDISQLVKWSCDNVVARSKMRVVATSVSDAVTMLLCNVTKTLLQSCYNVATTSTNGCAGAFSLRILSILSRHWNVKELQNYIGLKVICFLMKTFIYS